MEFFKCWDVCWKGPGKQNKPDVVVVLNKVSKLMFCK